MSRFEWSDELSVGLTEIDEQHQKWFAMLNELYEALHHEDVHEVTLKLLGSLTEYTTYHFKAEEAYMESIKFIGLASHQAVHAGFIEKIERFKQEYAEGKAILTRELLTYLMNWLITHIKGTDRKYANYALRSVRTDKPS